MSKYASGYKNYSYELKKKYYVKENVTSSVTCSQFRRPCCDAGSLTQTSPQGDCPDNILKLGTKASVLVYLINICIRGITWWSSG